MWYFHLHPWHWHRRFSSFCWNKGNLRKIEKSSQDIRKHSVSKKPLKHPRKWHHLRKNVTWNCSSRTNCWHFQKSFSLFPPRKNKDTDYSSKWHVLREKWGSLVRVVKIVCRHKGNMKIVLSYKAPIFWSNRKKGVHISGFIAQ